MFSVVNGVLLTDVQYRDPERVTSIWQRVEGWEGYTAAGEVRLRYPQYRDLVQQSTTFEGVALYASDRGETTLSGGVRPELVRVGAATASLLQVLGVSTALGRWFMPEEEGNQAGDRSMVTVLSHGTWVGRYGQDRDILGRAVLLNGRSYTVVGVLPPGFRMQWLSKSLVGGDDPGRRDFWVPIGSPDWIGYEGSAMWEGVGRLAPGVSYERARAEAGPILRQTWEQSTEALIMPRVSEEVRGLSSPLLLLFGATGLLLLIACGNVAVLSLGEMSGREQEVTTRMAVGAGRGRIARQLLTESVLLGVLGSTLGALVTLAATRALVALAPPIPRIDQVEVNLGVLGFAALVGTVAGLLFGVAPAVVFARKTLASSLRSTGRGDSRRKPGVERIVIAGAIALATVLLVGSGLLARSLSCLMDVELGFDAEGLVALSVQLPRDRYPYKEEAAGQFVNRVLLEMEAIPGVTAASAANDLPFPGHAAEWAARLTPEDSSYLMPRGYHVAPGHLDFMDIPILEGRGITAEDGLDSRPVTVVSESLARALWRDGSPVGREMVYPVETVEVVGVVGDVQQSALNQRTPLTFYVPFAQHNRRVLSFAVRTASEPADILPAMREALWRVDGDLAISSAGKLDAVIARSAKEERYRTVLMGAFAALATLLATVGITGVTARSVAQQTRELGIRKALGAEDGALVGGVLRSAVLTGSLGVGVGLLGALGVGRVMAGFLFGVEAHDPLTYAAVSALFLVACAAASYLPARRVVRVDPVRVLNTE
jgi:predicted permease